MFVGPFLERATGKAKPDAPPPLDPEKWEHVIVRGAGVRWLGILEALLSLIAFEFKAYIVIAGWLGFKVAAKWESWGNVVQVPTELEGVSQLDWLQARNGLGSWLLTRFLLGTLGNIFAGIAGYFVIQLFWL